MLVFVKNGTFLSCFYETVECATSVAFGFKSVRRFLNFQEVSGSAVSMQSLTLVI